MELSIHLRKAILFVLLMCMAIASLWSQRQLQFLKNEGQWENDISYKAQYNNIKLAFMEQGISYCISREFEEEEDEHEEEEHGDIYEYLVWNKNFVRANLGLDLFGTYESDSKVNYILGNDPSKWVKNGKQYEKLTYNHIYENIHLHYYSLEGRLKYDYEVKPGGKISDIQLSYEGIQKLILNEKGQLVIQTEWGNFIEETPYSYQNIEGNIVEIQIDYELKNDTTFQFKLKGEYNDSYTLIIDPYALCWSTFLGGDGSYYNADLEIWNNEAIVLGYCDETHPITPGVYQNVYGGSNQDCYISKISEDGSTLVFSTFLGGSGYDSPDFMEILPNGDILLSGNSMSNDFPTTAGAYQTLASNMSDVFLSKLSSDGSDLISSTMLGGVGNDQIRDMMVGSDGIYLSGYTGSSNFPITAGVAQGTYGGGNNDGYISKLSLDFSTLMHSTYIGGNVWDEVLYTFEESNGDLVFCGNTGSTSLPVSTDAVQAVQGNNYDVFYGRLSANFASMEYLSYLGGDDRDQVFDMKVLPSGNIMLAGITKSTDFPTSGGAVQPSFGGVQDVFLIEINHNLTTFAFSTYLGGAELERTGTYGIAKNNSFQITPDGTIAVYGVTESNDFPTTAGCFQGTLGGGKDAFFSELTNDGSIILNSTYLGGSSDEFTHGINVTPEGKFILYGTTESADFYITPSSYQPNHVGNEDVFLSIFETALNTIEHSTLIGGDEDDYKVFGSDLFGCNLFLAPTVHSMNFPVTPGAYQTLKTHDEDTPSILKLSVCDGYDFDVPDSNLCDGPVKIAAPLESAIWWDGSTADTIWITDPGIYWVEADTGCGGTHIDTFEIAPATLGSFDLLDSILCEDSILYFAPLEQGLWFDGSSVDTLIVDAPGIYWYEADTGCGNIYRDTFEVVASIIYGSFDLVDSVLCSPVIDYIIPIPNGVWLDGSSVDTFMVNTPGVYWYEADTGCGNVYRDTFEVIAPITYGPFDIQDTVLCDPSIVFLAPLPPGQWSDGSSSTTFTVNDPGIYWFEADTGCGNVYRDTFEVIAPVTFGVFDITDSLVCEENLSVVAPITPGIWWDGSSAPNITINNSGIYWYEADTGCGHIYRDTFELDFLPNPPYFDIPDQMICPNQTLVIYEPYPDGNWSFGNTEDSVLITAPGIYWFEAIDDCGREVRDTFTISEELVPMLSFMDTGFCRPFTYMVEAPFDSIIWWDGSSDISKEITEPGLYWYSVKNNCNITYIDTFMVLDDSCNAYQFCAYNPFVPNTFTPNENNLNETFYPVISPDCIEEYRFIIFDRWGEVIFETNEMLEAWDGTFKGVKVKQDIYAWKLVYRKKGEQQKEDYGLVNVIY